MNTISASSPSSPPEPNAKITGMHVLANALRNVGIDCIYGLVGIPVTDLAYLCQEVGIRFIGFRHEQQAGMAAATHGYLTRTPGVLLTVSSLGFLNGLTATANATVNCYPMIQISGSSQREPIDLGQGNYEGLDQLNVAKGLVKAAYRVNNPADIPTAVARAYRAAVSGRPGGVYLDVTEQCLGAQVDAAEAATWSFTPVDPCAPQRPAEAQVERAMSLLASARKPVIILGKGAAYAQADERVKQFVEQSGVPFFPMSMAKGLLPDNHPLCAIAARSTVMEQADVVMLLGARLNWLLSRGGGKWNQAAKFIQVDIDPMEFDCNRPIAAPVAGDIDSALTAMLNHLEQHPLTVDPTWTEQLHQEAAVKTAKLTEQLNATTVLRPMTHQSALAAIKPILEANPDVVLVNEGANTLDLTRDCINQSLPRRRIDCATWAIMGMGIGSCVGAAIASGCHVVAIEGDSAFGFSGMDFSTVCRYKLPCTVIVFNNGGIYNGIGVNPHPAPFNDPAPTSLCINDRYDKFADAFGAAHFYVDTPDELSAALTSALASRAPSLIHVQLSASSGRESGHIGYLNPESITRFVV
jgi:oxalyl-CoA decarboxylase